MSDWAEAGEASWLDDELAAKGLRDKRLTARLRRLLDRFSSAPGKPIPAACADWAATKAAYRFFDNPRVTEHAVLAGHFSETRTRFDSAPGPILLLQDTTELNFKRDAPEKIGFTKTVNGGEYKAIALAQGSINAPTAFVDFSSPSRPIRRFTLPSCR